MFIVIGRDRWRVRFIPGTHYVRRVGRLLRREVIIGQRSIVIAAERGSELAGVLVGRAINALINAPSAASLAGAPSNLALEGQ